MKAWIGIGLLNFLEAVVALWQYFQFGRPITLINVINIILSLAAVVMLLSRKWRKSCQPQNQK